MAAATATVVLHSPPRRRRAGLRLHQHDDVRAKCLLEHYAIQAELPALSAASTGAYCVANPLLPDCPLTFVSSGFVKLSGHTPEECVGRNCRFLQCEQTDKSVVAQIRPALAAGESISVRLLNQRKNGERFVSVIRMEPLINGVCKHNSSSCAGGSRQLWSHSLVAVLPLCQQIKIASLVMHAAPH